jgi:DNA-binding response OmpR family regulator
MSEGTASIVLFSTQPQTREVHAICDMLCVAGIHARLVVDADQLRKDEPPALVFLAAGSASAGEDLDALDRIKRDGYRGLVIVVGHRNDAAAAVEALDRGADDYVPLRCDSVELVARVRALVRRAVGSAVLEREIEGVVLDLRRSVVRCGELEVSLTRREADLLEYLTRHAGHPVSREELATHIWHAATPINGGTNVVDVYVSYLRRKLSAIGRQSIIRSVRGVGYELRA